MENRLKDDALGMLVVVRGLDDVGHLEGRQLNGLAVRQLIPVLPSVVGLDMQEPRAKHADLQPELVVRPPPADPLQLLQGRGIERQIQVARADVSAKAVLQRDRQVDFDALRPSARLEPSADFGRCFGTVVLPHG